MRCYKKIVVKSQFIYLPELYYVISFSNEIIVNPCQF